MNLTWIKCEGDKWCPLLTVNLDHSHFSALEGIYVIWHGGQAPWTVYVGQGIVAERLRTHRGDQEILQYSHLGLFVTWARVDQPSRDGIERFLSESLRPRVGSRTPAVPPIQVNYPW